MIWVRTASSPPLETLVVVPNEPSGLITVLLNAPPGIPDEYSVVEFGISRWKAAFGTDVDDITPFVPRVKDVAPS